MYLVPGGSKLHIPWCPGARKAFARHIVRNRLQLSDCDRADVLLPLLIPFLSPFLSLCPSVCSSHLTGSGWVCKQITPLLRDINCEFNDPDFVRVTRHRIQRALKNKITSLLTAGLVRRDPDTWLIVYPTWMRERWLAEDWDGDETLPDGVVEAPNQAPNQVPNQ